MAENDNSMDIYLNPELKAYYMDDFRVLLTYEHEFWGLNPELIPVLIEINKVSCIQTLYSHLGIQHNKHESNLSLTFTKEAEKVILREIIPSLIIRFNTDESSCFYLYDLPHDNQVVSCPSKFPIKCQTDVNYWRVNHIRISCRSYDHERHYSFWKDLAGKLTDTSLMPHG